MAATDAPATSALSQTLARSRISTIAAITLSGTFPAASPPVETDARVDFVSASENTIVKCVQTLPPTRHNSEECGQKKKKKRCEEEEIKDEDEEKKLHKPQTSSTRVIGCVCPATFPILSAYTLLCFMFHAYHEIEIRVFSTLDLCGVTSLCGASWDRSPG